MTERAPKRLTYEPDPDEGALFGIEKDVTSELPLVIRPLGTAGVEAARREYQDTRAAAANDDTLRTA